MKGVIYTRVSSEEQTKGTSLEFQEELCRKYCEQKDIEVIAFFREEGETAKDLSLNNRKKFLEALEFCRKKKNQIQAFVVLRVDRFARNTEDHFAVRKILLNYGTALHSVTEPIGNKPAEKFIETVLSGAAEYENAIRKQRCIDGMMTKINQGIFPWKPPLGYKSLNFKKRGEKKTEPDPPDEQIFPLIQKALKEYTKGLYSQAELARMLDQWGLKAIKGKKTRP
jgi:site-specific DNA recombinase